MYNRTMEKKIIIKDVVGSDKWLQPAEGAKVYAQIQLALKAGNEVVLSFAGRMFVITAFLNAAIGKLYNGEFGGEELEHLSYTGTDASDMEKVNLVVSNAKVYYMNNPQFRDECFKRESEV